MRFLCVGVLSRYKLGAHLYHPSNANLSSLSLPLSRRSRRPTMMLTTAIQSSRRMSTVAASMAVSEGVAVRIDYVSVRTAIIDRPPPCVFAYPLCIVIHRTMH